MEVEEVKKIIIDFEKNLNIEYNNLIEIENFYIEFSQNLGVEFNQVSKNTELNNNILELKNKIQDIKENKENLQEKNEAINKNFLENKVNLEKLKELIDLYSKEAENEIKRNIDYKVQEIIIQEEKETYELKLEEKCNEKIGIIGKLFGKEKLRLEEIDNLELKIRLINLKNPIEKTNYDIKDILSDLVVCSLKFREGNFSTKMSKIYNQIKNTYKEYKNIEFNDEKIYEIATNKIQNENALIPVNMEKNDTIKNTINKLKYENLKLQNELYINDGINFGETKNFGNSLIRFSNIIKKISINLKTENI